MKTIYKIYNHLASDSLYKNSIYLMLSTAVMAFFGFFFWIINARLYSADQVGIATALISVMTFISSFSLLGLGSSLMKYLPTSTRKNEKINTSFTIIASVSALIALIYLIFINIFSPKLLFVRENIFFAIFFILFVVFSSLNIISENVFIAYRSSKYVLMKNIIFSITKLLLIFFFVALGAYGIFISWGIALMLTFIFSAACLLIKFNYFLKPVVNKDILKRMTKFSLANYVAGFISSFPSTLLPLIIINTLGARASAYFYMDLMIANLLYIIPLATSQSLFAEGSYNEDTVKNHVKKAAKIIALFLIPVIIITLFFGKYILLAFGKEYSSGGSVFLQLLAISSVFMSINYVGNVISNIKHKIHYIVILNTLTTCIILTLSYLLIHNGNGLIGIGVSWIIGQAVTAMIYLYILKYRY